MGCYETLYCSLSGLIACSLGIRPIRQCPAGISLKIFNLLDTHHGTHLASRARTFLITSMSIYRLWRLQRPHVTTSSSSSRPYRLHHPTTSPSTWQLGQHLCHMSYYRPRNGNLIGNGVSHIPRTRDSERATGPSGIWGARVVAESARPGCTPVCVAYMDSGPDLLQRYSTRTPAPARARGRPWARGGLESVPLSLFPPRKIWFLGSGYIYTL